jgi:hypothetical protein
MLLITLTSVGNLSGSSKAEERQHLEDALRRAALSCYASQGYYPPALDYITSRYGIQIDRDNFAVFYEVFAGKLRPQIDVVVKHE